MLLIILINQYIPSARGSDAWHKPVSLPTKTKSNHTVISSLPSPLRWKVLREDTNLKDLLDYSWGLETSAKHAKAIKGYYGGAGTAQWWEDSSSTNVARVQFPVLASYVGWLCCWFSFLFLGFFSGCSGFPPSTKTNISKFQFDLETVERRATHPKSPNKKANTQKQEMLQAWQKLP